MSNFDHKHIGEELELFSFLPEAPGMPFYFQNGLVLKRKLEDHWKLIHRQLGYEEIQSPQLFRKEMWQRSGHLDLYQEQIFHVEEDYLLKPMSCPGAILYFKNKRRSYRELPLRVCELGHVFRQELSGGVNGLLRARSFVQDDAHLFCSHDQIAREVLKVLELSEYLLKSCGFKKFEYELSLRSEDGKYLGEDSIWESSQNALREALKKYNVPFKELKGEAKFYGPAIDVFVEGANEKRWQMSSIQLDMNLPKVFALKYDNQEGGQSEPVMIHRALFGSLERFLGVLLEYHQGDLPYFLKPIQASVLLLDEREDDLQLEYFLRKNAIEFSQKETSSKDLGKEVQKLKVPYVFILGKKNNGKVKIQNLVLSEGREYSGEELRSLEFKQHFQWPEIPSR